MEIQFEEETQQQPATDTQNELLALVVNSKISESKHVAIYGSLGTFMDKAAEWSGKIDEIVITSPEEVDKMKMARESRLTLKKMRLEALEIVKTNRGKVKDRMAADLLEDKLWLKGGQIIESTFEKLEEKLEQKEKFAELYDKERKEKLAKERMEVLIPLGFQVTAGFGLGDMDEAMYQSLKVGLETMKKQKEQQEAEAEELRKKEAEEKEKEQKRIKEENEKINQQKDLQNKRLKELMPYNHIPIPIEFDFTVLWSLDDAAYQEILSKKKELYEVEQANLKAENEKKVKLDARFEKRKAELIKIGFTEYNGTFSLKDTFTVCHREQAYKTEDKEWTLYLKNIQKLIDDKKKSDKEADDAKAKADKAAADLKKKQDDEAAAAKAKLAAEKKAAKAPDKEKLNELAKIIDELKMPEVKSEEAAGVITNVQGLLLKVSTYIREKTEKI